MAVKNGVQFEKNENLVGYAFLFPMLAGFIVFMVFPLLFSLILSFSKWDFTQGLSSIRITGLSNFVALLKDKWFIDSMKNTIVFTVTTVPISIAISLVFAVLINKYVYFKNFLKLSLFLPYISSIVASAVVWSVMLHPTYGPVNEFLKSIGISNPPRWFVDLNWALPTIIAFSIWQQLGYLVLVYMSSLNGVSNELYEAAEIDGAGEIKKFYVITLPMVSPTTFFLLVMQIIGSFKVFDIISAITNGGPGTSTTVIAFYIYRSAFQYFEMGKASAAAWIMFTCIFAITIYQWRNQKNWVNYN